MRGTEEGKWYDYSGCFYPKGLDPDSVFYFNEENFINPFS
ncbi:DUF4176 domain-containing protein [Lentibacillus sp. L22]|nr:DUF4176 domain-containing protein [Lentibacillus daqui]